MNTNALRRFDMADLVNAKRELGALLARDGNVTGVGIGYATRGRRTTQEIAIIVFVRRKLPAHEVLQMIPVSHRSYRVDVVQYDAERPCNCGKRRTQ